MTKEVEDAFHAHAKSVEALHETLKAHCKPEKSAELQRHVEAFKEASQKLHDGGLACMI
jgi:predicted lipoprotein